MANPFQSIYNSILAAFTGSTAVTDLVIADNIVNLNSRVEPVLDGRQPGDLPCLILWPEPSGDENLHGSSSNAEYELNFRLQYKTDQEKLAATAGLWAMKFAIQKALFAKLPDFDSKYIVKFEQGQWSPLTPLVAETEDGDERGWQAEKILTISACVPHTELIVN
jgi:hypothetical protein